MLVYLIECKSNNKKYVGSTTKTLKRRVSAHFNSLKNDSHCNAYMQNSWNKFGESSFIVSVLEENLKSIDDLLRCEDKWMSKLSTIIPNGFNLKTAELQLLSVETKKKISIANKGRFAGEKHFMFGKTHSEESKIKNRNSQLGEKSSHWGKKKSHETRLKMSESAKRAAIITCDICGKSGKGNAMKRWHFKNCGNVKLKRLTCPHCGLTGVNYNITRNHFDKCKLLKSVDKA